MKKLSLVRLGSYAAVIGIAILLRHQLRVIPVHQLSDGEVETLMSEPERRKAAGIVVSSAGFQDTKLSGSKVIAAAQKKARKAGQKLDEYIAPSIALRIVEGRLSWIVSYRSIIGPFQFVVRIDDSTGEASYEDTTAPL